jgi:hypothetical protein
MAAAASLEPVSPELALVDAVLASRLRVVLEDPAPPVRVSTSTQDEYAEHAGDAAPHPEAGSTVPVDEIDAIADLIVGSAEPGVIVAPANVADAPEPSTSTARSDQPSESSGYPTLPSPPESGSEQVDATELVLREMRTRLTTRTSTRRRTLFRRRFTVASGLSAAVALGVLVTNVGYGLA